MYNKQLWTTNKDDPLVRGQDEGLTAMYCKKKFNIKGHNGALMLDYLA
jgi:hypothetical protein